MFTQKALQVIEQSISEQGILASCERKDNYARVWARDSMMTGITGILIKNRTITDGLKKSIQTLVKHQAENGQIPSNVDGEKVSYGTLAGRTDATVWWIIGACEYILYSGDEDLKKELKEKIDKAFSCLKTWEFNQRGLLYSPLGGNWADEYVTSGYVLYDNVLRYWAFRTAAKVYEDAQLQSLAGTTKELIENNFRKNDKADRYHEAAYQKASEKPYLWASLNGNGYDERFDLAGNALAVLLGLELNLDDFTRFLEELKLQSGHWMLPVFYPIIFPDDADWNLLENNYSYQFKNHPYHFHNGGSWPIHLGWLCLGLKKRGYDEIPLKILNQYEELLTEKGADFREYYSTDQLIPSGTEFLCFSASGYLLMKI
ncbi:amylo-alpha-1,6-glucosidase [Chryseobacterium arthrosphaerae]|uniref:amylo-alpha-1,6-glucosidase n=1 Tax=Chryseobacterium arthrosphaerae TaxID=651561 RepID=UPI002414EC02|nr:glycoside hydrolase 100 family protein [Chryseobacterium arthrosphaerae]MDG4654569.1 glycoside hydrolase 100 family protein [Chryseobacterium arthrosphaerae]